MLNVLLKKKKRKKYQILNKSSKISKKWSIEMIRKKKISKYDPNWTVSTSGSGSATLCRDELWQPGSGPRPFPERSGLLVL